MAYKVGLPHDLNNSLGGLSLPKKTGDSGDSGDRITEGRIHTVEICSNVLEAHIWLAFGDSFAERRPGRFLCSRTRIPENQDTGGVARDPQS